MKNGKLRNVADKLTYNKKETGITLIALVITIIVLLILAAVSIAMLTGENGLLNKATKAREDTIREEAKEKLKIVLLELQADKATNSEYNETTYIDKKIIENNMTVKENIVTVDGFEFTIDRSVPTILEETENVSAKDIAKNPAMYYGKEVKYSTKRNTSIASIGKIRNLKSVADVDEELEKEGIKWKIFYADEDNIYLIASNYVKVDGDNYYKIFDTASQNLEYMNTKSNWNKFVGECAEYATGGPTLAMFANSWNSKYPDNEITYFGDEENGFVVNKEIVSEDDLYFNHKEMFFYGYWLASKSREERYLVNVSVNFWGNNHLVFSGKYEDSDGNEALKEIGYRPIVCLKSDIQLQASEDGFIILENLRKPQYTYKNPIVPVGFNRINTDEAKWEDKDGDGNPDGWNNGLVIEDSNKNQFVWVPVDGDSIKYDREYKCQMSWGTFDGGVDNTIDEPLPNGVTNEEEQITKYGGFYIGRYEAGVPDKNSEPENIEGIPISQKDAVAWTNLTYPTAKVNAEKMYTSNNVKSGLMTTRAWITMCKWIITQEEESFNILKHGNYIDAIEPANVSGYGKKQKTGYSEKWKNKNIYDLFGNVEEMDNSKDEYDNKIVRGGCYTLSRDFNGYGGIHPIYDSYDYIGFRTMLYIK